MLNLTFYTDLISLSLIRLCKEDLKDMPQPRDNSLEWVQSEDDCLLAYKKQPGLKPWVIFLGGFRSDMEGLKAQYLAKWCESKGRAFLRLDYSAHGKSEGVFDQGSISRWTTDTLTVVREIGTDPCVLVGSSMGGWIMLRVALAISQQVKGLIGIAAAPDFTQRLISRELTSTQKASLRETGKIRLSSEYDPEGFDLTQAFIDDGDSCCVLDKPLPINLPVNLIQGCKDTEVPWETALHLANALESQDVNVQLIKDGDHRLSSPSALKLVEIALEHLLARV